MRVSAHIAAALPLGVAISVAEDSASFGVIAALSRVLIDLDHVFDYFLMRRRWMGVGDFFRFFAEPIPKYIFFIHGWEWVALVFFAYYSGLSPKWFLMVGIGVCYHLIFDQIAYARNIKPLFYFFSFRAVRGFRATKLFQRP